MNQATITPIDLITGLDRIEEGVYLAKPWARGRAHLDGWQLERTGRVYGVSRVPGVALRRCLADSWVNENGETVCTFYVGAKRAEIERITRFIWKLRDALDE